MDIRNEVTLSYAPVRVGEQVSGQATSYDKEGWFKKQKLRPN
jgi:hypothetical protein